ncbi:hypothetical protein [Pseudonocardia sp. WMMC193]|uniref:hypothetical protein n=1 Tax=Pseudonocardia sp. WMMC193 TaxID=2911965 RepID=UPI001F1DE0EA|nr:hypothetical protein [Pseudonocardia sp. WMMC193]MCF7548158.1 hypothetical protein [Pseudonocardia sp. WMMC193]
MLVTLVGLLLAALVTVVVVAATHQLVTVVPADSRVWSCLLANGATSDPDDRMDALHVSPELLITCATGRIYL